MLVAHRLLREYHQLEPALRQMGFEVVFDSRAQAVKACILHDTDPDGYNHRLEIALGAYACWLCKSGGQHGAYVALQPSSTLVNTRYSLVGICTAARDV